jgi:hypothetical protein
MDQPPREEDEETFPPAEVTASAIAKTYQDKLQMVPGGSGTVTFNFVDCCATITNKLLDVPSIAWCLQDLDERSALSEDPNPFDSHSRLQAIIDKCKANNQAQLIWVVQGIWYSWRRGGSFKSLSIADIKGSAQSGDRGVADLLIYKLNLKSAPPRQGQGHFRSRVGRLVGNRCQRGGVIQVLV